MLDNTITLAVDLENTGSTTNEVYNRYDEYQDRSVYIGPNHALDARQTMTCYRTKPKPSGKSRGVAKTALKFSEDVTVPGTDGADLAAVELGEISFSLPVGTSAERAMALRQRMIAALDSDSWITKLVEKLEV
jgi:hypothetical protein